MKRIAFIIPYFGKFNNYFQLFLNSCKMNPDVTWIIFTDDKTNYVYPDNVRVTYTTFQDIQRKIQKKFNFEVSINRPYKLCDYKPAYGYIFEDELTGFDFWGYCDTDMIWGNISDFIGDDILDHYDKIGIYGHCTIYKNSYANNRVFMKPLQGVKVYKRVLSDERNHSFDEEYKDSVNNIFIENELSIYSGLKLANIYMKSSSFKLVNMNEDHYYEIEKKTKGFFVWNKGKLERFVKKKGIIFKDEFLYIHMQSRPMKMKLSCNSGIYKIIPNAFEIIEAYPITAANFNKIRCKYPNLHYIRLRFKNFRIKCKRLMEKK